MTPALPGPQGPYDAAGHGRPQCGWARGEPTIEERQRLAGRRGLTEQRDNDLEAMLGTFFELTATIGWPVGVSLVAVPTTVVHGEDDVRLAGCPASRAGSRQSVVANPELARTIAAFWFDTATRRTDGTPAQVTQ